MKNKAVYIIAGPNADLIAQGLAPFEPRAAAIKAGRLVLQQIHEYARRGADFAFETTLSGKSYASLLTGLKKKGYGLHLFFLWIPGSELAIARIKDRVAEGGHNVPAEDVRRRFTRGLYNFFNIYEPLLDSWMLFDNSKAKPALIAKRRNGHREVINADLFAVAQRGMKA